jgi:hypothetical protein
LVASPLLLAVVVLVPFAVLLGIDQEQYFLSAAFGAVFTAAADPGARSRIARRAWRSTRWPARC